MTIKKRFTNALVCFEVGGKTFVGNLTGKSEPHDGYSLIEVRYDDPEKLLAVQDFWTKTVTFEIWNGGLFVGMLMDIRTEIPSADSPPVMFIGVAVGARI